MVRPEATAELIRTLDEKYVANAIAFEAMIAAAALILDGATLRGARRRHRHRGDPRAARRAHVARAGDAPAPRADAAPRDHARLGARWPSSTSPTTWCCTRPSSPTTRTPSRSSPAG